MTSTTVSSHNETQSTASTSVLYRIIWKWHFIAALYVLPFILLLSLTGGIYLYKPQIEAFIYHDRLNVPVQGEKKTLETQQAAVLAAAPGVRIRGIKIEEAAGRTSVFEIQDSKRTRSFAWVNPYTAEVIRIQDHEDMLMYQLKKLHGELLLGETGTKFVELAANWTLIMFITGLYLWWPRGKRGWADAFSLPKGKGRQWWKQTHLFTGLLASILIIPILISGLPWTDVWGGGLSYVQTQTGQKSPSLRFGGKGVKSTPAETDTIPYAQVINIASQQGLLMPYEVRPPKGDQGTYWIRSASKSRWDQTELLVDQYSGKILKRISFEDFPIVAKTVSLGISFHQGELYGWFNTFQNTIATLLGILLAVSGAVAWWKRKPAGSLGIPTAPNRRIGTGLIILIVGLSLFLPLMGVSLLLVITLDYLIFQRLGWFQSNTEHPEVS